MTDDNKNSNLIIFGIAALAAMLFGYLIYSSRNQQQNLPQQQPITQPIIQQSPQTIDNTLLYRLEFQSQQMADNLKMLQDQQRMLQEQQLRQLESVTQLEAAKCNNVVSMGLQPSTIFQMKKLPPSITPKLPSNKRRESEEEIANRIYGMT